MANSEDTPITSNYVTVSGRVTPTDGIYREKIPVKISQEEGMEETLYTDSEGYYEGTILLGSSNDIIAKVGNDKAIWKLIDGIVLSSDKQIISYNGGNNPECATITAQLTKNNSNVNISGENITFEIRKKSDDSLVETLTATTDSSGIATVSYYGKGAGDIYIKASCMFVFKRYDVHDCLWGTDGSSVGSLEVGSGVSCTSNGDYITITTNTSGEKYVKLPVNLPSEFEFTTEIAENGNINYIAWQIHNGQYYGYGAGTNGAVRISGSSVNNNYSWTKGHILKIIRQNGTVSVYYDNTLLTSNNIDFTGYDIGFYTNQGRVQHLKNIMLKPL